MSARRSPGEGPGARPLPARRADDEVRAVGQRVRRAGHRFDGEAAAALALGELVAGVDLQPWPLLVDRDLQLTGRTAQPDAGPAVVVPLEVGQRGVEGAVR